jgi:hypothetical protein
MTICGDTAGRVGRIWPRSSVHGWAGNGWARCWPRARGFVLLGVVAVGLPALAGCTSNDSGELLIDPGRYSIFKCDELAARWKIVSAREKELRGLMDKASQSNGGAIVGSLAYRADYDTVVSDERLLQRTAAEKNCGLPFQTQSGQSTSNPAQGGQPQNTQFQSDQSIR